MSNFPTGILARINIRNENGALLEATSLNTRVKELGIAPSSFDGSTNFSTGTELELSGKKYKVTSVSLQFLPRLDSNRIPALDSESYFTDTNEPLPMNLMILVIVRPI